MSVTVRLSNTLDKSAKLTHKQTTKMICVLWSDVIELKQFRHQKRAWMNRPEQSGHCQHRATTTQHWTISHRFLPNQKNYVMEGMRASFCLSLHHSRLGFQTKRLCVCVCVLWLWGPAEGLFIHFRNVKTEDAIQRSQIYECCFMVASQKGQAGK